MCVIRNSGDEGNGAHNKRVIPSEVEGPRDTSIDMPRGSSTSVRFARNDYAMRRYSQRHSLSTLSEINITPLLDLAFVLLIIFMITTPLLENSVNLVIPSSGAANAPINPAQVQTISIDRQAVIKFNNKPVQIDELLSQLKELKQTNPEVAVVIRPDRELPVQKLMTLMDALQRAQISKVGIATKAETKYAMPRDARFWRNVTIIAVAHAAILFALARWNRAGSNANPASIVWMMPAEAIASNAPPQLPAEPLETPAPRAITTPAPPEKESEATPANLKSDIQLPAPTPVPTATPVRKPSITPTPVSKTSPKPTAKPTPKSTPKKTVAVKATALPKKQADVAANQPERKSDVEGPSGPANGAARASEFAWYGRMLHDRFHNEWQQPTSIVATGAKMTAVVKIRIEKDGRVSSFTIVKASGNVVVDESVAAIAKRVTQVDPLPRGLVSGNYYEVKINFELNPEQ